MKSANESLRIVQLATAQLPDRTAAPPHLNVDSTEQKLKLDLTLRKRKRATRQR